MYFDVIIIGAGVIGSSIARELTRRDLTIAVIEQEADTPFGISCRNSGVLHSGIHYEPGSLRARFDVQGNSMTESICRDLNVACRYTGKITAASSPEEVSQLYRLKEQGEANGVPGLEILDNQEMQKLQPGISGIKGLYSPSTGIINPVSYTIALAEHAMQEGAQFFFLHEVTDLTADQDRCRIACSTPKGTVYFEAGAVINASGLSSDHIARMTGWDSPRLYPCRGEYYVLDKRLSDQLNLLIYPVPGAHSGGLGVHLTLTTEGNILIGPSNEYLEDRRDNSSTREIMELLKHEAASLLPTLETGDFIRSFSGVRPKLTPPEIGGYGDFVITRQDKFIHLIGIESPGLTSAPAIAVHTAEMVDALLQPKMKQHWNPSFTDTQEIYRMPYPLSHYSREVREEFINRDPDYGTILCRCEGITRSEVISAVKRIKGPVTLAGIKQRCRTMTGRCQGGFCLPRITDILQEEHIEVLWKGPDSPMYMGSLRSEVYG